MIGIRFKKKTGAGTADTGLGTVVRVLAAGISGVSLADLIEAKAAVKVYSDEAKDSATEAKDSADKAKSSEDKVQTAANAAANSEVNALNSATAAKASEDNAKVSETNAAGSVVAVLDCETKAKASADAAAISAKEALDSENEASGFATEAETFATDSGNHAKAAALSEANAATSEGNAKGSEDAAAQSASTATASKNAAKVSENKAKTSETNAKTSETNALNSKNAAKVSETNAKTSETNAKTSETNASGSAGSASQSKLAAAGSASAAAASKNAAKISETNAKSSETKAEAAAKRAEDGAAAASGAMVEAGAVDLSSGKYPAPVTDGKGNKRACFWKVSVGGTVNGTHYGVGDSLVYSAYEDSYHKIDSTESVSSVNGKKGTVVLTAANVGALPAGANAISASKWAASIKITLAGDTTGSVTFDGAGGKTLTVNVKDNSHKHTWGNITSIPATATRWPTYGEVTGKPATYPPSTHGHTIAQVTGLQAALDSKQSGGSYVPTSRKVNGKDLTKDITLGPVEVGCLPVGARAANSLKLDGKTRAQIVAEARGGNASSASTAASVPWAGVTGKPAQATRWPSLTEIGAFPINKVNGTPAAAYFTTAGNNKTGIKIRLPFRANSSKMVSFTVRVYQGYVPTDIQFSGYLYSTTNNWYSPKAIMIAGASPIAVSMGRDSDGIAYVWIAGGSYKGVGVFNVVGGYKTADWNSGWSISESDSKPNVSLSKTVQPNSTIDHTHSWGQISGKPAQATRWPTAAEAGALPITGGGMRGRITSNQGLGYSQSVGSGWSYIELKSSTSKLHLAVNHSAIEGAIAGSTHIRPAGGKNGSLLIQPNAQMKHQTSYGYVLIGSRNSGHCHYETDRADHWFNKPLAVQGEIYAGAKYNKRVYHTGYKPTAADVGAVLSKARNNWKNSGVEANVVGQLTWNNYGNNHTIFDASASKAPDGKACNNTNPNTPWKATYPTLMGWNGSSSYGVRVDRARYAESIGWGGISGKPAQATRWPTLSEIKAADLYGINSQYNDFTVGGSANTYYPVLINDGSNAFDFANFHISRGYNWPAPSSWYKSTHKGGLTFSWQYSGDSAWGGNDKAVRVTQFNETYSKMVAGMVLTVSGLVVWLRGGGAKYRIRSDFGKATTAKVYLGTYTSADKKKWAPRANVSKVTSEIYSRMPIRSNADLYDRGARVYSANNKPIPKIAKKNVGSKGIDLDATAKSLLGGNYDFRLTVVYEDANGDNTHTALIERGVSCNSTFGYSDGGSINWSSSNSGTVTADGRGVYEIIRIYVERVDIS